MRYIARLMAVGLEDAQFLKGRLDGNGKSSGFALVHLRRGIHHHEECEKQGDEVGIRHKPPVMVVVIVPAAFFHRDAFAAVAVLVSGRSCRKPTSLASSILGFMPSRMEMTPSNVISRTTCSSRMRMRSLPELGRKKRLAAPTPYTVATKATAIPLPTSSMLSRCCMT